MSSFVFFSFLTSPDKVNGLKGFNFTWTEVRLASGISREILVNISLLDDDMCIGQFKCTYNKFCIDDQLKCDGNENCGLHDDTDEAHCK